MSEYQYESVTPELLEALKAAAPGHVTYGDEVNEDFERDEMPIYGKVMPQVVVEATSTEEVAAVMKLCNEHHVPVTPRGAGTGLVGGAVPIEGGVLISTAKMNKILSYDTENMVVRVQAGVLLNQLADDAAKQGFLYPPDPGEKFATLGGNVSTNAGGMRAVKYGTTRDYVRAMTVVLPTGEILHLGASVSKSSSGYSLLNLMVGSEGTLGIVTELTLKLIPMPKEVVTLVVLFESLDDCISTVPKLMRSGLQPQALEFMEREIVRLSESYLERSTFPQTYQGSEINAYLLVTFDGDDEEQLSGMIERASEVVLDAGALDVLVADTAQMKKDAWAARSSFLEAIEANTKLLDECDVVVPVNEIAHFLTFVKSIAQDYTFEVKSFGHAGDGNLHIYTCSSDMELEEFRKQVDNFMEKVYAKATELGGQISGEHGIGHGKLPYLEKVAGPVSMRLMKGIKEVFDPNMILNPGKVCYKL
ncbi:MAG: FAD-binding oxidoreductase [Clostridiales bacterium]|nr:FAD-binding oxidoreductase [Clostridiales bacterium]